MTVYRLKDIKGKVCWVDEAEVFTEVVASFGGMTIFELIELRRQYCLRGGPLPITVDSIKKVFEKKVISKVNMELLLTPAEVCNYGNPK